MFWKYNKEEDHDEGSRLKQTFECDLVGLAGLNF